MLAVSHPFSPKRSVYIAIGVEECHAFGRAAVTFHFAIDYRRRCFVWIISSTHLLLLASDSELVTDRVMYDGLPSRGRHATPYHHMASVQHSVRERCVSSSCKCMLCRPAIQSLAHPLTRHGMRA